MGGCRNQRTADCESTAGPPRGTRSGRRSEPPKVHLGGRFRSWQGGMVVAGPDPSVDDPDGDRTCNACPEGLSTRFERLVDALHPIVDLLDQGLMGLTDDGATFNGMYGLDSKNGLPYRPDRRFLTLSGGMQFPPNLVAPAANTANTIRSCDVVAVMDPLSACSVARRTRGDGKAARAPGIAGLRSLVALLLIPVVRAGVRRADRANARA